MAFNSLNTIDKDCVTVANDGQEGRAARSPPGGSSRGEGCREPERAARPPRPSLLPVSPRTAWFLPSLPLVLGMDVGVPPAYREKMCSVLSWYLFNEVQ